MSRKPGGSFYIMGSFLVPTVPGMQYSKDAPENAMKILWKRNGKRNGDAVQKQ